MVRHAYRIHPCRPAQPAADGAPPDWVHLVPAGTFRGADGRGPYTLANAGAVIAASMAAGPLVLDENHATDHAAKIGAGAPAQGWIVELQARDDGIWGRIEWTPAGLALMAGRAYRGISPAFFHDKSGRVQQLVRAALTNVPNLTKLKTLHTQGNPMDLTKLREALGLPDEADEAAILAAVTTARQSATALQSQVTDMAGKVVALQTQVDTAAQAAAKDRATAAIDAAITAGKPIKALRDHYIARHMADADAVAKELDAMVSLHSGGAKPPKPGGSADGALDADELRVVALMGIDPEAFKKAKAAQALAVEGV